MRLLMISKKNNPLVLLGFDRKIRPSASLVMVKTGRILLSYPHTPDVFLYYANDKYDKYSLHIAH